MKANTLARLGNTEVWVTQLGLGTGPMGGLYTEVLEGDAHATVRKAWELGVRFFDTAPVYGLGLAEARVGHVLANCPRKEYVLATKIGRLLRERPGKVPDPTQMRDGQSVWRGVPSLSPIFDFSTEGVRRSLDESLERLGLDRVDVLHLHDPDDASDDDVKNAVAALVDLRREGIARAIGVGMNQWQMLAEFAQAEVFNCFLLAGRYTLLDQSGLSHLLPLCEKHNVSVITGGVYNSGILADPYTQPRFDYGLADARWVERAKRLYEVCERHGVPLKAAAIQFPLAHPAVASVVVGARSPEEIDENVRMFEWAIPPALWEELRAKRLLPEEAPVPMPH